MLLEKQKAFQSNPDYIMRTIKTVIEYHAPKDWLEIMDCEVDCELNAKDQNELGVSTKPVTEFLQ